MGDYHLDVARFTNPRDSLKAVWRFKQENEPAHMIDDERMFYDWIEYFRYSQRLRVDGWYGVNPVTNEMTLRPPKRCRCKTRKRFVKLLMADGFSRNEANVLAKRLRYIFSKVGPDECNSYHSLYASYRIVKMRWG